MKSSKYILFGASAFLSLVSFILLSSLYKDSTLGLVFAFIALVLALAGLWIKRSINDLSVNFVAIIDICFSFVAGVIAIILTLKH
ncbi:hypothetical protein [Oenococcus oeni]|uniref:hypothetical protein n=1 Tax=Oenococcus oeni TaxID=1247 RepID=UPI0010BBB803|nr:hypothetical protein [Oenococcus oeni]SYW16241.1 membrane hypothetical protein [Oenococcus oeni]SYW19520.1 membrane hypothetical protein [Oenococcus oeni]